MPTLATSGRMTPVSSSRTTRACRTCQDHRMAVEIPFSMLDEAILHLEQELGCWNIQLEVAAPGTIDVERVRAAAAAACAAHPMARAAQQSFTDGDGHYRWRITDETPPGSPSRTTRPVTRRRCGRSVRGSTPPLSTSAMPHRSGCSWRGAGPQTTVTCCCSTCPTCQPTGSVRCGCCARLRRHTAASSCPRIPCRCQPPERPSQTSDRRAWPSGVSA